MVKILDIKISKPRLILRILTALILTGLSVAVLYAAPQLLITNYLTLVDPQLREIILQLVNTAMPMIGLIITGVVFITMMLRKTKAEGPLLICLGLAFATYVLVFFNLGKWRVSTNLSQVLIAGAASPTNITLNVTLDLTIFMLASLLCPMLIILKGYLLIRTRRLNLRSNLSNPQKQIPSPNTSATSP